MHPESAVSEDEGNRADNTAKLERAVTRGGQAETERKEEER